MTSLTCLMLRAPMVKIFKTSALMLALGSPMLCHAGHPGDEVIGKWKFSGILDLAEMTSLDEKGARKLVGRVMTIRKDGTRFDGEVCQPPDFETKRVEPNLYLQKEAGVGNTKLRLPNPVTVVDISCTQVYIKKRNRAVIFWNGFFFDAVKVAR